MAAVIANAEERGLDFLAITDHDRSMHGAPTQWHDPEYRSEKMILLYGVEWTTAKGHGNLWSDKPFDYAPLWQANLDLDPQTAIAAAHTQNALFSINHPAAYNCCAWEYAVSPEVDCIEVWHAPFRVPNKSHLAVRDIWDGLLLSGRVLPGVGGSDSHQLVGLQSNVNLHGSPATWVYAQEPTARSVLTAIEAGRISISYSAYADRVELDLDTDGDGIFEVMQGDVIPAVSTPITLRVEVHGPAFRERGFLHRKRYTALIYRNGTVIKRKRMRSGYDSFTFEDTPEGRTYYRVELRGSPEIGLLQRLLFGRVLGLTNPIYIGYER